MHSSIHMAQEVETLEAELAVGVQAAEAGRKRKRGAEAAGAKEEEGAEGEDKEGLLEDSKEGLGEPGGEYSHGNKALAGAAQLGSVLWGAIELIRALISTNILPIKVLGLAEPLPDPPLVPGL